MHASNSSKLQAVIGSSKINGMFFSLYRAQYSIAILTLLLSTPLATPQDASPARQSSSKSRAKPSARGSTPDLGTVADSTYRNVFFGFSYKIPFGWVERTEGMRDDGDTGKSMVLLAVFERPPEATGNTVNSAVVIAAESLSSYPGLRTAADYFAPLTEVTLSKGFKVVNEPFDFSGGANQLVRGDFSKEVGTLTMHQSSVVLLKKSYVVSFTVIGGSEDEVDELLEKLSFSAGSASRKNPKSK
jgi:hypothetical protein